MRIVVTLAIGIVIGVAIGSIPAENWQSTVASHAKDRRVDCAPKADFSGVVGDLLEDAGKRNGETVPAPASPGEEPSTAPSDARPAGDPDAPRDPEAELAAAKTALELRRTQARAALIEDAGLDDQQIAAVDQATAAMNAELLALTDDLVADVKENGPPSRHDSMLYAEQALEVMITAEEQISAALTDDQRADLAPEATDPLSYVDPAIVDHVQQLRELVEKR